MAPPRTRYVTPWTPPAFKPFPPGQRSRPAMGTGPAEAGGPGVIGNVFLTIDPLNGQAQVGQRVTITGYRAGGNAPITISWAGPPGSSAPLDSTERSISWIVQEGDSGTYTVTATSPGAADSPQSAGIALTVVAGPPTSTIGLVTITGIIVPPEPPAFDPDAAAYIAAVEAADGQALEDEVRDAINDYVVALKGSDHWDAILLAYLFCGARTFAGAIQPLKGGRALAAINMVAGDYNRRRMRGDGVAKMFNVVGTTGASLPANNMHTGAKVSELSNGPSVSVYVGSSSVAAQYHIQLGTINISPFARTQFGEASIYQSPDTIIFDLPAVSVISARSSSTVSEMRYGRTAEPIPIPSDTSTLAPSTQPLSIFDAPGQAGQFPSKADILYVSFGTALSTDAYAAVIDTHIDAILAAIP